MLKIVQYTHQQKKKTRSRPIDARDWNTHRKNIEDWHKRGLPLEKIQILLTECGFAAT